MLMFGVSIIPVSAGMDNERATGKVGNSDSRRHDRDARRAIILHDEVWQIAQVTFAVRSHVHTGTRGVVVTACAPSGRAVAAWCTARILMHMQRMRARLQIDEIRRYPKAVLAVAKDYRTE